MPAALRSHHRVRGDRRDRADRRPGLRHYGT
jgi:hypothetical protein